MARKRYSPEIIIRKLREAEVLQGQGRTIAEVVMSPSHRLGPQITGNSA